MYETSPHADVLAQISRHLGDEHGRPGFDPQRHVTWPGHVGEEALAVYIRETAWAPAGFTCLVCDTRVFPVAPSYGHPFRNAQLVRDHPELGTLTQGLGPDERAMVAEEWDRGRLAGTQLREVRRRVAMATRRSARPVVEERRVRVQRFLLERYVELGTVEATIGALVDLARIDPVANERIVGRPQAMSIETYRRHWHTIPLERREEARRRRDAARSPGAQTGS